MGFSYSFNLMEPLYRKVVPSTVRNKKHNFRKMNTIEETNISYLVGIKFLLDKLSQLDIALPVTEKKHLSILSHIEFINNQFQRKSSKI